MTTGIDTLSDKEKQMLALSYLHFTKEPEIECNGLAAALGYTNAKSCKNALVIIAKKMGVASPKCVFSATPVNATAAVSTVAKGNSKTAAKGEGKASKAAPKKSAAPKSKAQDSEAASESDYDDDEHDQTRKSAPATKTRGRKTEAADVKVVPKKPTTAGQKRKASGAPVKKDNEDSNEDSDNGEITVAAPKTTRAKATPRNSKSLKGKSTKDVAAKKGKYKQPVEEEDDDDDDDDEDQDVEMEDSVTQGAKERKAQGLSPDYTKFPNLKKSSASPKDKEVDDKADVVKTKASSAKSTSKKPAASQNNKLKKEPKDAEVKSEDVADSDEERPAKVLRRSGRSVSRGPGSSAGSQASSKGRATSKGAKGQKKNVKAGNKPETIKEEDEASQSGEDAGLDVDAKAQVGSDSDASAPDKDDENMEDGNDGESKVKDENEGAPDEVAV